jgi:hypothetical protein
MVPAAFVSTGFIGGTHGEAAMNLRVTNDVVLRLHLKQPLYSPFVTVLALPRAMGQPLVSTLGWALIQFAYAIADRQTPESWLVRTAFGLADSDGSDVFHRKAARRYAFRHVGDMFDEMLLTGSLGFIAPNGSYSAGVGIADRIQSVGNWTWRKSHNWRLTRRGPKVLLRLVDAVNNPPLMQVRMERLLSAWYLSQHGAIVPAGDR